MQNNSLKAPHRFLKFFTCFITITLLMTASHPAHAFTPLAYLGDDGSGGEEVRYLYWQQIRDEQPIPFSIGDRGTPDIGPLDPSDPALDEFEALELAFRSWENVSGIPVTFELTSSPTNQYGFDGENVIFFGDLGNVGYGGVTLITFDNETGQLLDVDVHINDYRIRWRTSLNDANGEPLPCPCQGRDPSAIYTNDVQGLATHEIGHVLGLDHSAIGFRESSDTPTMYPRGIWNVPGEGTRPPNSYYRSLEADDDVGIHSLNPTPRRHETTGGLMGEVDNSFGAPLFGAHVVAKNMDTGEEVGAMSGILSGPFHENQYLLSGLAPGVYQVRVEPLDGSPPGFVGKYSFTGMTNSVVRTKFPKKIHLGKTYHRLAFEPVEAEPVEIEAGMTQQISFGPLFIPNQPLPEFTRFPQPFEIRGNLNVGLTGELQEAVLAISVDGAWWDEFRLPVTGEPFVIAVPQFPAGSLIQYQMKVAATSGRTFYTLPVKIQTGLSSEPIVVVSKQGGHKLGVVDTKTFFEFDETNDIFSFPLEPVYHRGKNGVYVANFGDDTVSFIPFSGSELPATDPHSFDQDGDGLIDDLESVFGTDVSNPDTDDDLILDGIEISKFNWASSESGNSYFDAWGGTVAENGQTQLGHPFVNIGIYNVTERRWMGPALRITPSGRFRLRLPTGSVYHVSYYNRQTRQFLDRSPQFTGANGERVNVGVTQLNFPPPNSLPPDTGTDPLDPMSRAGLLLPPTQTIALDSGADPGALALNPVDGQLFVTGSRSNKLYKINTETGLVVNETTVGSFPRGVMVTADGTKVYVANKDSRTISVLRADDLSLITTITLSGRPRYVRASIDPQMAVVTMETSTDLAFLNTATDTVLNEMRSGLGGLVYLAAQPANNGLMLAGRFHSRAHELVTIHPHKQQVNVIDLGPNINTTSGVAIHPDGERGYAVHYMNPALIEFDTQTGATLRTLPFEYVDIRDLLLIEDVA